MEVLYACQVFKITDGFAQFAYTKVLLRQNGIILCAKSQSWRLGPEISSDELEDLQPIPPEAYCPRLPTLSTIIQDSDEHYTKLPDLIPFDGGFDLADLVLRELTTCELIKKHPHPSLATYYGCLSTDGRVSGLCFKSYSETLMDKVNPQALNKSTFVMSEERASARKMAMQYLPDIEAGIQHLHKLGIVHNDLNPANIMITEDDKPVIIDFDSSSVPGTALDRVKRTHGWFDPAERISRESNDLDAFTELRLWLTCSSPEEFLYKE